MKKLLLCTSALVAIAASAFAQVANISTTAASSFTGLNLATSMPAAISNTYFGNDGSTMLVIRNTSTAVTATIVTQAQSMSQNGYGSVVLSNLVVPVPNAATLLVGPFPTGRWNTQFGTVAVSFTSVANVSITAVSIAQ